jgi:ribonuclease HI
VSLPLFPEEEGRPSAELYSDGASSGNPGPAGIGYVLIADGHTYRHSEDIGEATNNIAEYTALIRGLEKASSLGVGDLTAYLDSELVVRQINGEYKVKNPALRELYNKAVSLLKGFSSYSISHIPRERNKEADALSKKAVAGAGKRPLPGK